MMFLEPFRTYGVFKTEYGPKGLFYRSVLKDSIIIAILELQFL